MNEAEEAAARHISTCAYIAIPTFVLIGVGLLEGDRAAFGLSRSNTGRGAVQLH